MEKFFLWFSGGPNQYMNLFDCMRSDYLWITINCFLCFSIVVGYMVIAAHWYRNFKNLKQGLARSSLFNMVNIFLFCGICGYLFVPIKLIWPAWRLYAAFLFVLAWFTWRYAINTPKLRVIYEDIHMTQQLTEELEHEKQKNSELVALISSVQESVTKLSDKIFFGVDEKADPKIVMQVADIRKQILEVESKIVSVSQKIE